MSNASLNLTRYASAILGAAIVLGVSPVSPLFVSPLGAQSLISGDISGTVTDPSGATVPNAQVTVKNTATGATKSLTTNDSGNYRASLLQPGLYSITVAANGFSETTIKANVSNGQVVAGDVKLSLGSSATSVEVSAGSGLMQTEQAEVSTSFDMKQIQNIPNPGNDLTFIAQISPGAVMNNGAGYGNFSSFGLPATSNLFTVDGANENDPFLNLNNSGATNILLGQNDIEQATVVNNGYEGQYGGLGGSNVNYVTRSGSNKYHGDLKYWWNGSSMNANSWFNNNSGVAKSFSNVNQWAADFGGPAIKDKTFFFVNTEGIRILLPTSQNVLIPSTAYQAQVLAANPGSAAFYNNIFKLYNSAPGASAAVATADPNVSTFRSAVGNQTSEWLLTARFDQQIGQNDHLFIHFKSDHGNQATVTDPINSAFNGVSIQPGYEGQLNETHAFSSSLTNQFIAAGSWSSAVFSEANRQEALSLMPESINFTGSYFSPIGHDLYDFPQGRNVTQYQFIDDVTKIKGNHTVKFGVSYRRDDVTDYGPQQYNAPLVSQERAGQSSQAVDQNGNGVVDANGNPVYVDDFIANTATVFQQNFPQRPTEPIALYTLAGYLQDAWKVSPSLTVTASLRAEHNSNPVCQTNCFSNLTNGVSSLNGNEDEPYNQKITTNLNTLFPSFDQIAWEPRFGFAWSPENMHGQTVVRGGFGIFADTFPATVAENLFENAPNLNTFVLSGNVLDPSLPNSANANAAASNKAFASGFTSGATYNSLLNDPNAVGFSAPSFTATHSKLHNPTYFEYNLAVQQQLARNTTLTLNYVGNHGMYEPVVDPSANTVVGSGASASVRDGSFSEVTEVRNQATSNDNSFAVSLQHTSKYLTLQANYTWQHSLDEISNGGFLPFTDSTNESIFAPIDPSNLKGQYSNSDYDIRNNFTLAYVLTVPKFYGPRVLSDGWQLSGTVITHSGAPYSIIDGSTTGNLSADNYFGTLLATQTGNAPKSCDAKASVVNSCFAGDFASASSFSGRTRNAFVGPNYFNTDFTVYKSFSLQRFETGKLQLGAQFVNLFNHTNFDQPVNDVSNPQFGQTLGAVSAPTSLFGSFLGGDASPRQIQLTARFQF